MIKSKKIVLGVGTIGVIVIMCVMYFVYQKQINDKNGNYYFISANKDNPQVSKKRNFSISGNDVRIQNSTQEYGKEMSYKNGVIIYGGKKYARKNSSAYKEAVSAVNHFNTQLANQKQEIKQIEKDINKQLEISTEAVEKDFLNGINGTYTAKRTFEYAHTSYIFTVTIEGENFKYNIQELDDFLHRNKETNMLLSGKLTTDEIKVEKGTEPTQQNGKQVGDDEESTKFNIKDNIQNEVGISELDEKFDILSSKLDEGKLAFSSKDKKEYTRKINNIKKINNWATYKDATKISEVFLIFNGKGTLKSDTKNEEVEDVNQYMTINLLNNGDLDWGYSFNSWGSISDDITNELVKK